MSTAAAATLSPVVVSDPRRWWSTRSDFSRDTIGSCAFVLFALVLSLVDGSDFGEGSPAIGSFVSLLVGTGVAVSLRRRFPVAALALSMALAVVGGLVGDATLSIVALMVTMYAAVAYSDRLRPWLVWAVASVASVLGQVVLTLRYDSEVVSSDYLVFVAVAILPVALGRTVRSNRVVAEELALRNAELERLRVVEADRAVADERRRIARELHDVLAHSVSGIAVRSRAGAHVFDAKPEDARDALRFAAESASEVLASMRRVVEVLRDPSDGDTDQVTPQPGLADLPTLIESYRTVGLAVEAALPAQWEPIGHDIALHSYRVVQEALTNVVRHASATTAWVDVTVGTAIRIVVEDDGRVGGEPAHVNGHGHGLTGMRERVALCDGSLSIDRSPVRSGWRIVATLPNRAHA
jgi:signal transduction histidine kinase